ncbi:hypothetical protein TNCV_4618861 [Trichonephila clavipes]|nr:hypothetical protein TNCV_4618861 [Trichonephila clavipes]
MVGFVGKTRPLPGHSSIGSICTRKHFRPGVHPLTTESNKGGSVSVIWQIPARRLPGVHPEYSAAASGRGSNGYTGHSLSAALTQQQCLFGDTEEGTTSRLTGAGSLLPPVYSEAWAKGIPRTPFSSLRDTEHGKHVGRKTNAVSQKQIK